MAFLPILLTGTRSIVAGNSILLVCLCAAEYFLLHVRALLVPVAHKSQAASWIEEVVCPIGEVTEVAGEIGLLLGDAVSSTSIKRSRNPRNRAM